MEAPVHVAKQDTFTHSWVVLRKKRAASTVLVVRVT